MLFEEILMKKNFNAEREIIFVDFYETFSCDEVQVRWGQRGRFADTAVIERAKFIVGEILPELDLTDFFASQPMPFQIPTDISYCTTDYTPQNVGKMQQTSATIQKRLKSHRDID